MEPKTTPSHPNNPLHGVTLEMILVHLERELGWARMFKAVEIRCFLNKPTIKSSLVFLRRTPWARAEVEKLYLATLGKPVKVPPARPKAPSRPARRAPRR
jgi:uncharacterized protein (DUF2132 family)